VPPGAGRLTAPGDVPAADVVAAGGVAGAVGADGVEAAREGVVGAGARAER
jgi:hypothetical protein